jgi:hypothetical protein
VLRGMSQVLARNQLRHVLVEVHTHILNDRQLDVEALAEPLISSGFREVWSSDRGNERHILFSRP